MGNWFTCDLGDAMLAAEALDQIKALFLSEYQHADRPNEMALFIRHESEGALHCHVKVYFSPATATVAQAVGAVPCQRPAADGLDLLAGSEQYWSVLLGN